MSAFGISVLHSLKTSSLSFSCQSRFVLSRKMAQVNRWEVVSWPAKKKVLHSSVISFMLSLLVSFSFPFAMHDSSINPSTSFPYPPSPDTIFSWMICMRVDLNFLSSLHIFLSFFVGRYLQWKIKKKKKSQRSYWDYCWLEKLQYIGF